MNATSKTLHDFLEHLTDEEKRNRCSTYTAILVATLIGVVALGLAVGLFMSVSNP